MPNRRINQQIFRRGSAHEPVLTETANLRLWLDAAKTYTDAAKTTLAGNGDAIYTLADRSGNGFDFVQATAVNRPLLRTNCINGRPAINMLPPGADFYDLRLAKTVAQVFDGVTDRKSVYIVILGGTINTGIEAVLIASQFSIFAARYRHDYFFATNHDGVQDPVSYVTNMLSAKWGMKIEHDGVNLTLYANGVQKGQVASGATVAGAAYWQIYSFSNIVDDHFIAEILFYNVVHSAGQTASVYNYLSQKYGISFT